MSDTAIEALKYSEVPNSSDCISRQAAIDALGEGAMVNYQAAGHNNGLIKAINVIKGLPSAQPEHKKMSNKEWVDFLSEQFAVSRTSAREMLHGLMRWKAEDNFKKQYSGGRNEKE